MPPIRANSVPKKKEGNFMSEKTSTLSNSLIWLGAGISIAEILTGTLVAPLGFETGLLSVLLGHFIGCVLLFFSGLIGGLSQKSAMETVKLSFGQKGSLLFSSLNVLQLIGWTAVMIVSGASAASSIAGIGGDWVWCIVIGALIILWLAVGIKNLGKLNLLAMSALFILTVIMSVVIFGGNGASQSNASISFGSAVELSVAMPLSWLPLISDYTKTAKKPFAATVASCVTYFFTSVWMYLIGMGAALFTGENDIAKIMLNAGLGAAGIIIVIFSTVTTTFLDVYSAGVSAQSISAKLKEKPAAIVVCVLGTLLAIFTPITEFEDFLYLIGSVFAPMIAIQIADFFILKKDCFGKAFDISNLVIWLVGFVLYRLLMNIDTPVGYTLPAMLAVFLLCIITAKIKKAVKK